MKAFINLTLNPSDRDGRFSDLANTGFCCYPYVIIRHMHVGNENNIEAERKGDRTLC